MESLDAIFSSAAKAAPSESAPKQETAVATDVKTAEAPTEKPAEAAAAPSAAKTTDPAKVESAEKPNETAEQIEERTRNEKSQFVKADEVAALQKGLKEERRKRQEAEDRAKALEAAKQPEAPKKDLFEDPEGAIKERMAPELARIEQAHNAEIIALYEDRCRDKYPDFDAVMDEIKAEAEEDPALAQSLIAQLAPHRNKPEALYKLVVNRREMKAVGGDLSKYKDTITAEFKTKIKTLEDENKALKAQLDNIGKVPSSLNSEPSATRAAVEKQAVEPKSLEDIFKPRKRRSA